MRFEITKTTKIVVTAIKSARLKIHLNFTETESNECEKKN